LNKEEHRVLISTLNKKLNELKGEAFDDLMEKIEDITQLESKNQIWNEIIIKLLGLFLH
jgi:hypothetical protein